MTNVAGWIKDGICIYMSRILVLKIYLVPIKMSNRKRPLDIDYPLKSAAYHELCRLCIAGSTLQNGSFEDIHEGFPPLYKLTYLKPCYKIQFK
jgi:hypothetical protein